MGCQVGHEEHLGIGVDATNTILSPGKRIQSLQRNVHNILNSISIFNFVLPRSPHGPRTSFIPICQSHIQSVFPENKFHLICRLRKHLTEEKPFSFGHCTNYLSPPGQAADLGDGWMSRLAFSIPPSVEVVRVACRPAFHIRQKVSKMRKSSPWLV